MDINTLYDELCKKDSIIKEDLKWILTRCILEQEPEFDENGKVSDKNGKEMLNEFLLHFLKYNKQIKQQKTYEKEFSVFLEENRDYSIELDDLEEFELEYLQEYFSVFLSKREEKNVGWGKTKKYAKEFINKLAYYRHQAIRDINLNRRILNSAKNINNDPLRYIYELIQNADDCQYADGIEKSVEINIKNEEMEISYPEDGMQPSDIIAITTIGESNKKKKKRKRIIGEKGIGFKTIFSACENVDIYSGNFQFTLSSKTFQPKWIDENEDKRVEKGTKMYLHFLKGTQDSDKNINHETTIKGKEVYEKLLKKYGVDDNKHVAPEKVFKNCPIFFTNKIDKLIIRYDKEFIIIKREKTEYDTMKISYWLNREENEEANFILECMRIIKNVRFTYEEYISHYKDIFSNKEEYQKIEKENVEIIEYPCILIAPIKINNDSGGLNEIQGGNMFTYLPTFTNINARISIQIPFDLNEDRSCMWISGMNGNDYESIDREGNTTKWNARLFREVFISENNNPSLIAMFYEKIKTEESCDVLSYLPNKTNPFLFFNSEDEKYADGIKQINDYDNQRILEELKKLKIFKQLLQNEWRSIKDGVILFDKFVLSILRYEDAKEKYEDIVSCISSQNNSFSKEMLIDYNPEYREIIHDLGGEIACVNNNNKINFLNYLLEIAFEDVVKELGNEKHSEYIIDKKDNKNLKELNLITLKNGKKVNYNSKKLWIRLNENKENIEIEDEGDLGFYISSKNKAIDTLFENPKALFCDCDVDGEDKLWENIYNFITNREKVENKEVIKIECTYKLYREILTFLAKLAKKDSSNNENSEPIWYIQTKEMLEKENKNMLSLWKDKYKEYRGES